MKELPTASAEEIAAASRPGRLRGPRSIQCAQWRERRLYYTLLSIQTAGAGIFFGYGVPIYRQLLAGNKAHLEVGVILASVASIALIQIAYWTAWRWIPTLHCGYHPLLGHVAQFVGRLSFILAGGFFSTVFIVRFQELDFSTWRVALLLAQLFCAFCYSQELDRFAAALKTS